MTITHNTVNNTDAKSISERIIDIGKKCLLCGVKEVIISSIFIKRQFKLTRIIRQVNDHLHYDAEVTNFTSLVTTTSTMFMEGWVTLK